MFPFRRWGNGRLLYCAVNYFRHNNIMSRRLLPEEKAAWVALLLAQPVLVRGMNRVLAAAGEVSMEVYDVLLTLESADGHRMTLTELAEAALLSPSGMTRLVDRLEDSGYVVRERCPADRRNVYARLTEQGLAARNRAWSAYEAAIVAQFADRLRPGDAKQLAETLSPFLPVHAESITDCG